MEITKKYVLKGTIRSTIILSIIALLEIGLGGLLLVGIKFSDIDSVVGFIFTVGFGGLFAVGGVCILFLAIKSLIHVISAMKKTWYYNYFDCLKVEIIESNDSEENDTVMLTLCDEESQYRFDKLGVINADVVKGDRIIVVSTGRIGDKQAEMRNYVERTKNYYINGGSDFCYDKTLVPILFNEGKRLGD